MAGHRRGSTRSSLPRCLRQKGTAPVAAVAASTANMEWNRLAGSTTMRVLVIDDSRAVRLIIGKILRELGMDVIEAANGREALQRMTEHSDVELVLVDWNMPVINGLDSIRPVLSPLQYDALP